MDTTRRIRVLASASILALFLATSGTRAQSPETAGAATTDPAGTFIGVITADDVYVRAGGGDSYYPFGKLNRGSLIKVIGEKYDWARVLTIGPSFKSFFAYVEVDPTRVVLDPEGRRLRTTFRADLLAPNLNSKYKPADSWRRILDLKPGRTLTVLETIQTDRKAVHKVTLPPDAEGWISTDYVRPARPDEIARWEELTRPLARNPTAADPTVVTPAVANRDGVLARDEPRLTALDPPATPAGTRTPAVKREPETTGAPAVGTPASIANPPASAGEGTTGGGRPAVTAPREPAGTGTTPASTSTGNPPARTPATTPATTPARTPSVSPDPTGNSAATVAPAPTTEKPAAPTPASPPSPRTRLETLESAYQRLRAEPIHSAEVLPLRELYDRLATDAGERSRTVAQYARARSEQLTIWADLQSRRLEVDRLQHRLSLTSDEAKALRLAVDNAGKYVAVGRLATSRIYDGQRLPRLFRIQDAETGRTIAYLRPDAAFDLTAMVGQIVGVMGHRAGDEVLPVTLVKPRRIDMIAATESAG